MVEVVIVEDELLVRLGTKACLETYEGNIKVVGAFESGEDAIKYFSENTADVLITDIRLAGISGLELIKKVRQEHMHMRTVVLSCYEDFSYAREAMELGVDKYLLKHEIAGNELGKIVMELTKERKSVVRTRKENRDFQQNLDISEICSYRLGYLVLRGKEDIKNSSSEQIDLNILWEIIQKLLDSGKLGESFIRREREIFIVFYDMENEIFQKKLESFFMRMSRNVGNFFNKQVYLFITDKFSNLGNVAEIFRAAKNASVEAFYFTDSQIVYLDKMEKKKKCPRLKFSCEEMYTSKWVEKNTQEIKKFFSEIRSNKPEVIQVKAEVIRYFCILEEFMPERGAKNYIEIDEFDSVDMLEKWILEVLDEIQKYFLEHKGEAVQFRAYIEEHYQECLSTEKIAGDFHMSVSYFCQYFKKSMGTNFISYLNKVRIEKAKELLLTTDLSGEEIAVKIGIQNSNYFVRLFKKMTGQTVGEYRKKLK